MAEPSPEVVLYSITGCHLCETARFVILETQRIRPFSFSEITLDETDPRFALFAEQFPVIFVHGHALAYWRVTPQQLLNALN
jgi:hypothetical protein